MSSDPLALRRRMIDEQLKGRDIRDEAVLAAFLRVPRHQFVRDISLEEAYSDYPLSIGENQTISQPYIVASMLQSLALRAGDIVLEIGTGSGYQTALLAFLVHKVYSIESVPSLLEKALKHLSALNIENIELRVGDGTLGWKEAAPFDAIIVSAGAPAIPPPMIEQLAEGGRMIIPLGDRYLQELCLIEKREGKIHQSGQGGCVFVPLVGKHGWT